MAQENYLAEVIKESFDPQLISALFKNFSNQYVAFLELLDNAVDDMLEGEKLIISIFLYNDTKRAVIKNSNGKGMDFDDLKKYFVWGASNKTGKIGRYGQGGKAALGYLARGFKIQSHPKNSNIKWIIEVDDWQDRKDGFKKVFPKNMKTEHQQGLVITELLNLKKGISANVLKKQVMEIYRPLILQNKVEFYIDTERVICPNVNYDRGTKRYFQRNFELRGKYYQISGEYGIVSDRKSPRGGFNIYQYGRRVARKEYFGHLDPTKRWNVERLYGELYIDFDIPLLMNKTDIDRDSGLWKMIEKIMYQELKEIMREVIDYKTPTREEKKQIEKISKRVKSREGRKDLELKLTNYGPNLLFKVEKSRVGETVIKINRDHKAYKKWSSTAYGKILYAIMIYSLYDATKDMRKKEAKKFLECFSESLKKHNSKLL